MYGGGFDPPHNAHVALARAALQQLQLDQLFIVPTGDAYHKARTLSAGAQRLAMCQLAFGPLPGVTVSSLELQRRGSSYTHDTLAALQRSQEPGRWHLVMGADQAQAFDRWHRWRDILAQATIAIAVRPDGAGAAGWNPDDPLPGTGLGADDVRLLDFPAMDCSASVVRARAAAGRPVDAWVPPAVARYIDTHHLYKTGLDD